jgi:hypothetical protein
MKITKRQIRRIIEQAIQGPDLSRGKDIATGGSDWEAHRDAMAAADEEYYAPGGEGEQLADTKLKKGWSSWLEVRGLGFEDLDDLAQYAGAPNRSWLDDMPPPDGFIGPADIEEWAKDQKAAREILTTKMGSYKDTVLPDGRKISELLELDLEMGDVILTGKFKNKRKVVKDFGTDDLGQPTVNGSKVLNFRIEKNLPKEKWSKESKEALEFASSVTESFIRRRIKRIIQESLNEALPPHLQKHFRADGSSVRDPEWEDVTPPGYGPDDEDPDKRGDLMVDLKQKFGLDSRTTEEFDGTEGGVWINGESNVPETSGGLPLFDYYLDADPYTFGIHPDFEAFVIDKHGFAPEWHDPGTLMLWSLD